MPARYQHSLRFESDKCSGCMSCMRACPTSAVRIRKQHAVKLTDRCIDCGECIKVCPCRAIVPLTEQMADLSKFEYRVAVPSPVLYAQFDPETTPAQIMEALKHCGFDDVESQTPSCEAVALAVERYLNDYRGQYPLISSFCPTVVRLIQVKYPELVDQLMPILAPREIAAREARLRAIQKTGLPPGQIGVAYITSCPAKMVAILEHPGLERSHVDTAVSISDLFQTLAAAISNVEESTRGDGGETAIGLSWAAAGGLLDLLPEENTLTVAGLPNVIRILDDVEKGRLRRCSFIDCHACPEGCVGGCLTVEDPYVARAKIIRMGRKLPQGPTVDRKEVEERYRRGEYLMDEPLTSRPLRPLDPDISRAIVKMKNRDRLFASLPHIDCGACGAPTCRAFAEDVVLGETQPEECIFFYQQELSERIQELGRLVEMQRSLHGGKT